MSKNPKIKENKAKKKSVDSLVFIFMALVLLSFGILLYKSFDKVKTSNYLKTIKKLSQDNNPQNYKLYLTETLEKIKNKKLKASVFSKTGDINLSLKNYQEAITAYKTSYELDPTNFEVCANLGLALGEIGKYAEAINYLNISKKLNPEVPEIYINLGVQLANQKKIPEAIANFKKAIELNPKHYRAYTNLSAIYFRIKDYENTRKIINLAIQNEANASPIFKEILQQQLIELSKLGNAIIKLPNK